MPNNITEVLDLITPEQYDIYQLIHAETHSDFIQSGVMVADPRVDKMIVDGGKTITMPEYRRLNGEDQVMEEGEAIQTEKIVARGQVANVLYRAHGFAYTDLATYLSGSNPQDAILQQLGDVTLKADQAILLAVLEGIFASPADGQEAGALYGTHVSDQAKVTSGIEANMVLDAKQLIGSSAGNLAVIAMHSKTKTALQKQNLATRNFIPASESNIGFDTYLGYRVIVDDTLPVEKVGNNEIFTTYLMADGSIARNTATPDDMVTFAPTRDEAKSESLLYTRRAVVMHPYGLSFTGGQSGEPLEKITPTNNDLRKAVNWLKVREDKQIGLVAIKHRIS